VEGTYKEKGSKFLAFAYPVNTQSEIKDKIEELKKKYFDARHHCFGWMLGADMSRFRAFDDGEPNHSAGDPILGQIRSKGVTNVLVVVVRYFGGTKLGVGGLINAYRTAAEDALNRASIVEREITEDFILNFDYLLTSDIMRLIKDLNAQIKYQNFDATCDVVVSVPLVHKEKLITKLELMQAMGKAISWKVESPL
jgi:uncharacterized YigZ family protein